MVQNNNQSGRGINRRQVLQGVGGAGIVAVAGCLGDEEEEGDAPFQIQLEVNADNDDRVQMVELIAESMEQTGYFDTTIETYEWNTYVGRLLDTEYADRGHIACIGLSGTFNPESFCNALHHSSNHGQCCNLQGINDPELDEMMDSARYDMDVVDDPELRAERYDEVWERLAEKRYSSITHFDLLAPVMSNDLHGYSTYPFTEGLFSYGLYAPEDEQVSWLDRDSDATPEETGLGDLQEGGTLRIGAGANVDSYDPPYSNDTTSTMAQNFVFEQLITSDADGNVYPWLAEDYELVETQDIDRTAYEEYMISVGADEEGVLDTDEQIIVQHPEDDPFGDDEVRVLTPEQAGEAVADGTFGMQFQYDIREGVEFHNGEELTAEHVVRSYERYENSDLSAQTFDSALYVEEVDDYTVNIYAQVPDAEAERELPAVYIHSLEQVDLEGGDLDPRQGNEPIGTGPYEFEEFVDEQYAEYSKFDNYWTEELGVDSIDWFDGPSEFPDGPVIEEIEFEIVPDDATRSGALQNEEIDVTYGLATATLDDFEQSDGFFIDSVETGGYEYIQYPVNVEPWDDERLRKAVNHLVPRERIVENVLNGWARPAWTDIPQLAEEAGTADPEALEQEIKPTNEYDPERAEELLDEVVEEYDL
ncbi:peptide/nickel transport system substrate-binding protein [Halobiforma haloterrestris]|uniref:Peptide/nickel transport system substrate-binding protein n=1 Tax=Natronobacterium haloterrestre TaxID=148448 RepID=A0A1I1DJR6_NATHA|nr:ABC transporter substrate-binding protein [Halobiforma haloterrestris]SFB75195.1 peptide/nickel transport system substrate-binding protein [Halobiforma haloterrestris]